MNAPLDPDLIHPSVVPPEVIVSQFRMSAPLAPRAVDVLEDIVSLKLTELFPDIEPAIVGPEADRTVTEAAARKATEAALADIDFSMIGPNDTVNVVCSDHGFTVLGGWAYAEMLKTVKDVVEARTGNTKMRLVWACAFVAWEAHEILPYYGLIDYFGGRILTAAPTDHGIAIETEIGTLYGIKKAFNATWIIHCHYDSPREVHFHRFNGRSLKAFGMSYARMETRSVFHNNFGPRNANIVPRAIYESDFVQKKFVCGVVMTTAPTGVTGVIAGRDLIAVDRRMTARSLRNYAKLYRLWQSLESCIPISDSYRWGLYQMAGGMSVCSLYEGNNDQLDMDNFFPTENNPAVKCFVVNNTWVGAENMMADVPMIVAGEAIAKSFIPNMTIWDKIIVEQDLPSAVAKARSIAGTDHLLIFDGSFGSINVSRSLAKHMLDLAPAAAKEVDEVRMPKYLKQRGLPPDAHVA